MKRLSRKQYEKYLDEYDEWYGPLDAGIFSQVRNEIRAQGYLNQRHLWQIGYWKVGSSRNDERIMSNEHSSVKRQTRKAFAPGIDLKQRLEYLRKLDGVSTSVASSILCVWDEDEFCIIDKIVWKAYRHFTGEGRKTFNSHVAYQDFLRFCREEVGRLGEGWNVRKIEAALYAYGENMD